MAAVMHTSAVLFLSNIYFERLDEEAIALHSQRLNSAIESAPRTDFFVMIRALFRVTVLRDAKAALADVERGQKINPSYSLIRESAAFAHMLSGRFTDAIEEFAIVIDTLPDDPLVQYRIYHTAIAQFCGGDHAAAIETLQGLIDRWPDVRAYHILHALALKELGDETASLAAEARAANLSGAPHFHAPRPSLSDDWLWLIGKLKPETAQSTNT